MTEFGFINLLLVPAALGLLGFIEPCSIGSSLVFIKYLERKEAARKMAETVLFAATRAAFIGVLGVLAVLLGTAFLGLQKGAWILLGAVYLIIGTLYATGRARLLMQSIGPRLSGLSGARSSIGLGVMFGLNIPACAAPLPLILAVLFAPARQALDWLAGLSGRMPFWTGVVLMALGLWSIGFGLFTHLPAPA
jgi:cytochrome c-type biogenesis protein